MNDFVFDLILNLYIISLSVIFIYSSHGFIMMFYQKKNKKRYHIKNEKFSFDKNITIQLPIYNEKYVVERLINSVCEINYPSDKLEIQVLDDSTDETVDIIQKLVSQKRNEGFNIVHLHRNNRRGFKAGALNEGLKQASGEFIAIFDADFLPSNDFLTSILPYFSNEKIGMVQSRWVHSNENQSLLTKVQAFGLNGHFVVEQDVRNRSGFFINFNGTAGVLRKECLTNAGGWQGDTITEDLDLSYRAQLNGWQFIYLNEYTTSAVLPNEVNSLKAQQFRWTKGSIETAKKLLRKVWESKFNLRIKLMSTFHLTNNLVFPFILLVSILNLPIIFVKASGNYETEFIWMSIFIGALVSSFILYYNAQIYSKYSRIEKILLFPIFLISSMGLSISNTIAVFEGFFNKQNEFVRTPKFSIELDTEKSIDYVSQQKINFAVIFFEILFSLYSFTGVLFSIYYINFGVLFFNVLFCSGFVLISVLSLKHSFLIKSM